jgi:SAM-dependent methyltransferase
MQTFQTIARRLMALNRGWSRKLDTLLDPHGRRGDSSIDFMAEIRSALRPGMVVMDVGGGKRPAIATDLKASLDLRVIAVDISQEELNAAAPGCYDKVICGDVTKATALPEADLAVSRNVTEHVSDPSAMYLNILRALRPGGLLITYVPNKFAPYALINAALPNRLTKILLNFFHWESKEETGYPALYRHCYPSRLEALLLDVGFRDVRIRPGYRSEYCNFFLPLHASELIWQLFTSRWGRRNLCETFTVVAKKQSGSSGATCAHEGRSLLDPINSSSKNS